MRLPRVRLRTLAIAVAVAALALIAYRGTLPGLDEQEDPLEAGIALAVDVGIVLGLPAMLVAWIVRRRSVEPGALPGREPDPPGSLRGRPWRLPRLTMQGLMGLVLLLAVLLAGIRLRALERTYLERAGHHAFWESTLRRPDMAAYWESRWRDQFEGRRPPPPWPERPPFVPAMAEYHARMRAKWVRAARRPWLPIPADPPRPR